VTALALFVLSLVSPAPHCIRYSVTVTAQDANGSPAQYKAPYWLCDAGARPPLPAIMVCYEGGNPYARELWSHPATKLDVAWLCSPE
jgi:hypothetical protein